MHWSLEDKCTNLKQASHAAIVAIPTDAATIGLLPIQGEAKNGIHPIKNFEEPIKAMFK